MLAEGRQRPRPPASGHDVGPRACSCDAASIPPDSSPTPSVPPPASRNCVVVRSPAGEALEGVPVDLERQVRQPRESIRLATTVQGSISSPVDDEPAAP